MNPFWLIFFQRGWFNHQLEHMYRYDRNNGRRHQIPPCWARWWFRILESSRLDITRFPEEKTPSWMKPNMVVNSTKIRRWKRRRSLLPKNKSKLGLRNDRWFFSGRTFFGLNGIVVESCVLYCTDLSRGSEFRVCIRTWCFRCYVSFIYIYIYRVPLSKHKGYKSRPSSATTLFLKAPFSKLKPGICL